MRFAWMRNHIMTAGVMIASGRPNAKTTRISGSNPGVTRTIRTLSASRAIRKGTSVITRSNAQIARVAGSATPVTARNGTSRTLAATKAAACSGRSQAETNGARK